MSLDQSFGKKVGPAQGTLQYEGHPPKTSILSQPLAFPTITDENVQYTSGLFFSLNYIQFPDFLTKAADALAHKPSAHKYLCACFPCCLIRILESAHARILIRVASGDIPETISNAPGTTSCHFWLDESLVLLSHHFILYERIWLESSSFLMIYYVVVVFLREPPNSCFYLSLSIVQCPWRHCCCAKPSPDAYLAEVLL